MIYIDRVKPIQNELIYFYNVCYKIDDFNYSKLINQPWYQLTDCKKCQWCYNGKKYYKSSCLQCYKYTLKTFTENFLLILSYLEIHDIKMLIFKVFCQLNDINVEPIVKTPEICKAVEPSIFSNNELICKDISDIELQEFYDRINELDISDDEPLINYIYEDSDIL